ncbi:MAG: DUF167 domain-containing protein [Patescibacteria group bacterium]|nr:DUF167 domain-containing protein [Patescibacteria group bacterium]MDD5715679.1 DUF167 domain-containing protein [Patescibacteria group bacterium]
MWYRSAQGGVQISVKVLAGSAKSQVIGVQGEFLKVKVAAQRERGAANEELVRVLADFFHVSKSSICLLRGHTRSLKVVFAPISADLLPDFIR